MRPISNISVADGEFMPQALVISMEIDRDLAWRLADEIGKAFEASDRLFGAFVFRDMRCSVIDGEAASDHGWMEIRVDDFDLWIYLDWDRTGPCTLKIAINKELEGDDALDGTIDLRKVTPPLFWVKPAAFARRILA